MSHGMIVCVRRSGPLKCDCGVKAVATCSALMPHPADQASGRLCGAPLCRDHALPRTGWWAQYLCPEHHEPEEER